MNTQQHLDNVQKELEEFRRIAATIEGYEPKRLLNEDGTLISKVIKANGNNYIVLNEREAYTVDRFRTHLMIQQMLANAKSLEAIVFEQNKSRQLVQEVWEGKTPFSKLAVHLENIFENYFSDNLAREHIALYECTLFVVKEGANLNNWTFEEANLWIKDWVQEGIYCPDFFTLAIQHSPAYIEVLTKRMESGYMTEVEQQQQKKEENIK